MNKFLKSFKFAFEGLRLGFTERNFRIHSLIAVLVIFLGVYTGIDEMEWIAVLLCFALVMSLELINSAIEELANHIRDELKLSYRATKACRDLSAGAVLIAAVGSFLVGLQIFLPRFFQF